MSVSKKLGHLMLDLETAGDKSNSAILSIGAVEFNIETGETGKEFYERVDLQSCLDCGLKIYGNTFYWWLQKNDEARNEICKPSDNLPNVLNRLSSFMYNLDYFELWGNGAKFDIGILEDAYIAIGLHQMPWKPQQEKDVRTLVYFAPEIKANLPFIGVQHNPIADCKHQITYCSAIWNAKLKENNK